MAYNFSLPQNISPYPVRIGIAIINSDEDYRFEDVERSPTKTKLLMVVTLDKDGNRFTLANEVLREAGRVHIEEHQVELPSGMIVPELKPLEPRP
jgi:hypothetical protein